MILFIFLFLLEFSSCTKQSHPCNVILIVVDTLRADHLGCYGYFRNTSPNIDAFSENSIIFKNAISQAPWTTASVASMLTSLYPSELGIREKAIVLDESLWTLSELFKENGYQTKGIISHLLVSRELGFHQGFDDYDEENSRGHMHISSPSITEKAISFLREHRDDKFFLFLHYFDPHYNYIMHRKYNFYSDYDGPIRNRMPIKKLRAKIPSMNGDDLKYVKAAYDSEIRFVDEHIGKLFIKLKKLGLYENTLIVFTADHGEEFLEKSNWIGHSTQVFQEMVHVPLIIKLPGNGKKRIIDRFTELINLMPTIADYLGFKMVHAYSISGTSMNLGNKNIPERNVYSETYVESPKRTVINKGWKLIEFPEEKKLSLYNLTADPNESKDVGNISSENRNKARHLLNLIQNWEKDMRENILQRKAKQPDFTEEEKERLKAFGYIK